MNKIPAFIRRIISTYQYKSVYRLFLLMNALDTRVLILACIACIHHKQLGDTIGTRVPDISSHPYQKHLKIDIRISYDFLNMFCSFSRFADVNFPCLL